jgi:nitrite reductase/ring-hydroxylating ferredoxin subunit
MFVRNCWYVAAWSHLLPMGTVIGRQILDEPIALYRTESGALVAMEDRCPHRLAPLSLGCVQGEHLQCRYHGLILDTAGRCIGVPGSEKIPPRTNARTFPAVECDGWIWVWPGAPNLADEALIPRGFDLADQRFTVRYGEIGYAADYQLVNDNLCDLSHLDFLHKTTLGGATSGGWSDQPPRVTSLERGIRIERWLRDRPSSPGGTDLTDIWSCYDFSAPGILVMRTTFYPRGAAERWGLAPPSDDLAPLLRRVDQQAVTPTGEKSCTYLFAAGFEGMTPSPVAMERMYKIVMDAFAEDRTMIEAQQHIWDLTPAPHRNAFLPSDKAPHLFRKMLTRLIHQELNTSN